MSTLTDQPAPADPADPAAAAALSATSSGLRQRAEAAFREQAAQLPADRAALSPEATQRLLHELQVHQIELEMQNEELRRKQAELEVSCARYRDLYNLVPVGCCTVSETGLILEANLTLATWLGMHCGALVTQRFSRFIRQEDQDIFYRLRQQLLATGQSQTCELRLVPPVGPPFWAQLAATVGPADAGPPVLRVVLSDLTARKQTEAALHLSEEKFAKAFRSCPDAFILARAPDSRIMETNDAVTRISGYAPEELLGRTTVELGLWADPGERDRYVALVSREGRVVDFEAVFRTKSGARRTCQMSTEIIQLQTGPHFLSVLRDITERQQAEAQARRWQQVFTTVGFSLAHTDVATNTFLEVNAACAQQRGYTPAELVGQPITTIYPPEALPAMRERLKDIDEVGHLAFESVHRRKDGSTFPVLVDVTTIRDAAGRPISRVAYALDITEHRQAEAALRESEERFRAYVEQAADAALVHDDTGRFVDANETACQSLGYSRAELLQLGVPDVEVELSPARPQASWEQGAPGQRHTETGRHRRKDGTTFPVEVTFSMFHLHGRKLFLCLVRDITERRQAEESARKAVAALAESERLQRLALQIGRIGTVEIELATQRARWSPEWAAIWGLPENFTGDFQTFCWARIHPDDLGWVQAQYAQQMQDREERGMEFRIVRPDGALRWVSSRGQVVAEGDADRGLERGHSHSLPAATPAPSGQECPRSGQGEQGGVATRIVGVVQDITERKQAEAAQQQEHAFTQAIINSIPGTFYMLDASQKFIRWNDFERDVILGVPEAKVPAADALGTIHPADRARALAAITGIMTNGREDVAEVRVFLRGGPDYRWMLMTGRRLVVGGSAFLIGTGIDITERKQAELQLQRTTYLLAEAQRTARVGYYVTDLATGYWDTSPMLDEIFGIDADFPRDIPNWGRLIHPDDQAAALQHYAAVTVGDGEFRLDYRVNRRSDGELRWVAAFGQFEYSPEGKPVRLVGCIQDITERKLLAEELSQLNRQLEQRVAERTAELSREIARRRQTEVSLRASEQRHRDLVETIPDWVWEVDEGGVYIFGSPQCRDLLGYTLEEILGRTPFDFMSPEEAERVASLVLPVMARGEPICGLENTLRHKDGRLVIVETNGVPIRDDTGKLRGYCGLDHDITLRRQAETQLRKLQSAVEQSPTVVVITDTTGAIEYVNPQFTVQTGYTAAEALGQNPRFLQSGHHPREFFVRMWETLRAGHTWRGELCNQRKDGTTFWEVAAIAPIRDHAGGLTHYVAIKEDITERRWVAEELRRAKEVAEAANRAKSIFLANMSHEIRTPMNAILGFSQLLLRDAERSGRCQPEYVTTILRSGEHLLRIINDILEMARIESGRVLLNPAPFDFYRLLDDLERLFSLRAQTRQLRFQIERQGDVPRYLLADETKLRQVFINLLGNALKFTPNGGAITLRLRSEPEPDGALRLHAEIEDTGLGIAPEDLPHLFEPFFQTLSGRQVAGGTGLGLPISQEFVRLLGGKFEVASQVGVGSTFRFDVRVSRAQATAAAAERAAAPVLVRLRPGQPPCRVLIVDDRPENCELLVQLLAPVGLEIRTAADGAEAVAQCQAWAPHLVLMDLRMPGMDGHEAIRRIRAAHGARVKIIALSASVFTEERQRAEAEGADAFLAKPFDHAELLERIRGLVGVDYVDAAPREAVATVHDEVAAERPTAGEIRRLPADLVAALREATRRADYQQMLTLVEQVATQDERLGRLLRQLVKRFDHDTLHELLAAHTPTV